MKISLTAMLLLCLSATISYAQEKPQTKKSEFGISVGANTLTSSIKGQDSLTIFDQKFKSKIKPGFSLGILYRYRINDLLILRTQAEISFSEIELYHDSDFITFRQLREMINIDLPLHLVFEKTHEKMVPSVSFGGRYRYDLGVEEYDITDNNGEPDGKASLFRKDDVLLDVGVGVAFKMERFTFKPEFVYSRGLLNQSEKILSPLLESVYSNQFSLRFLFYGS